jgi:hypothetical protein
MITPKLSSDQISGAPRVFLRRVPEDLVLRFYEVLGYKTFVDEIIFSKQNITERAMEQMDDLILDLYPYIRKSRQWKILNDTDVYYYIRILRNLAQNSCLILTSFQNDRTKTTYYRLIHPNKSKSLLPPINSYVATESETKKKVKISEKLEYIKVENNLKVEFN